MKIKCAGPDCDHLMLDYMLEDMNWLSSEDKQLHFRSEECRKKFTDSRSNPKEETDTGVYRAYYYGVVWRPSRDSSETYLGLCPTGDLGRFLEHLHRRPEESSPAGPVQVHKLKFTLMSRAFHVYAYARYDRGELSVRPEWVPQRALSGYTAYRIDVSEDGVVSLKSYQDYLAERRRTFGQCEIDTGDERFFTWLQSNDIW